MHSNNYDALKAEMSELMQTYTVLFLLAREAILRDDEKAKTMFLEGADYELDKRLAKPFVESMKSKVSGALNGCPLESLATMKQTSDVMFLVLEQAQSVGVSKSLLKKIYGLLRDKGVTFFPRENAQDILNAIINHFEKDKK